MQHEEGRFTGAGDLALYYQCWRSQQQRPKATLVLVHGLGGHSSLFENLVSHLLPWGYVIYGLDLRGHGRSPGQRGHIITWAEFREDLSRFLQFVWMREPDLPCFVFGHSLGSVITLDYVLHCPGGLHGVIASAPPVGKFGVPPLKVAIGQFLSWAWPSFALSTSIDPSASSRNPDVLAAHAQDTLKHTFGSARLLTEFLGAVNRLHNHAGNLQLPLLIVHGSADRIAFPAGSRNFFEKVAFHDKELREYPEAYHELYNDINYEQVLQDLDNWINQHLELSSQRWPQQIREESLPINVNYCFKFG